MKKYLLLQTVWVLVFVSNKAFSQNDFPVNDSFSYEIVTSKITLPWGIDFLPDGTMMVTDKSGDLYSLKSDSPVKIMGVPKVLFERQGGLMDIKVHPDYAQNGWIYFSYSKGGKKDNKGKDLATTAIFRAKLKRCQSTIMLSIGRPVTGKACFTKVC